MKRSQTEALRKARATAAEIKDLAAEANQLLRETSCWVMRPSVSAYSWPGDTIGGPDFGRSAARAFAALNFDEAIAAAAGSAVVGQSLSDVAEVAIDEAAAGDPIPPVHPGEVLLEEFIRPRGLSPIRTAKLLGVPRTRIERLVTGETALTEDTALRLERLFGASAEFWLALQTAHDLAAARQAAGTSLDAIQRLPDLDDEVAAER